MGGDLAKATEARCQHLWSYALRDPIGANLDRIQIIKGWLDRTVKPTKKSTMSRGLVGASRT